MLARALVDSYGSGTQTTFAAQKESQAQAQVNSAGQVDGAYLDWNMSQAQALDLARGDRALEQNSITHLYTPY